MSKELEATEGEYLAMRAPSIALIEKNLTQAELSLAAKVLQKTISTIEAGKVNPTINTLAKIAHGLGLSLKIEFV